MRRRQNSRTRELKELADGPLLVALPAPRGLGKKHPESPAELLGRLVACLHRDDKPGQFFTRLVDHARFSAGELIRPSHERWEIELAYDELKTHLLEPAESLRSRLPEGMAQEIWGLLLACNLVRREMVMARCGAQYAHPSHQFPLRHPQHPTAFVVRRHHLSPGTIPKHIKALPGKLRELLLPERRSERRYPRHVKIKMCSHTRNRGTRQTSTHDACMDLRGGGHCLTPFPP